MGKSSNRPGRNAAGFGGFEVIFSFRKSILVFWVGNRKRIWPSFPGFPKMKARLFGKRPAGQKNARHSARKMYLCVMGLQTDVSALVPLLNEEESLRELYERIEAVCREAGLSFEIIMVDDGSTDGSWQLIRELSAADSRLRGVKFKRNYGKSAALNTGFALCRGRVVITLDADLQDSPEEIPELFRMIVEEGYDLVSGWKKKRYDPLSKTVPTKLYNYVNRKISGIPLHDFNCGLKAYSLDTVRSIEIYGEMHRYIPVIAKWNGFRKIGEKVVQHHPRKHGVTKFGLSRFINGPLDLLSINFVSRFRKRPMHFFGSMGLAAFAGGLGITAWLTAEKFYRSHIGLEIEREVIEQPLFFLALTALIIGVQLFLAGFIGELVSLNSPNRNDYVIDDRTEA